MSVPETLFAPRRLRIVSALLLSLVTTFACARGPEPPLRVPLASLGYLPVASAALAASGSLSTVHFIDEEHLLVTFNVRHLMKRLPDDPPDDTDRTVEAVVVHLTSGRVLARTHWRLHDSGQYLWGLGYGRFLLRIRDTLTTFVPLENLSNGDPFVEQPFLISSRRIAVVLLSPDRDLLTVESLEHVAAVPGESAPQATAKRTQINFYRLVEPVHPVDKVIVQSAGLAVATTPIDLSLTSAGYVEVLKESADRWLFDFDSYAGKWVELSPFDTTCRPHAVFVSASEFVAFGCRGSSDRLAIGGFNMHGEQVWQQNFMDAHAFPNFAFAPAGGRFALSRNIVASTAGITVDFAPSQFTTQEIRVYQMYNGKQLLRVEASPVQRVGQNYDLSPEGLRLAVLHAEAVELYRLPALSREDEVGIRAAKALQPEDTRAPVNLASHVRPAVPATSAVVPGNSAKVAEPVAPSIAPTPALKPEPAATAPLGDVPAETGERRKPPTLYTLPTDKPPEQPR